MLSTSTTSAWTALCSRLNPAAASAPLLDVLEALYNHPPRQYHNLTHIESCIGLLQDHRSLASQPDLVELALWLHDCIYDATRADNEARSAAIAMVFARDLSLNDQQQTTVADLIMTTKHAGSPAPGDHALIADIDMSILAASPDAYDRYSLAIRSEYSFASDADYRKGRGRFIESLLARHHIFHTPEFQNSHEARARANLQRELAALARN